MNSRFLRPLQFSLALLDTLSIYLIFAIFESIIRIELNQNSHTEYFNFSVFLSLCWAFISTITKIYKEKYITRFEAFLRHSMLAFIYFFVLVVLYHFFLSNFGISYIFLLFLITAVPVILFINRLVYYCLYIYLQKNRFSVSKLLIIGFNPLSQSLVKQLEGDAFNKEIVGFCEEHENVRELSHYPVFEGINNVMDICKRFGVNEIYSTIAPEQNPNLYNVINIAEQNCIRFKLIPDISVYINRHAHLEYINQIPVISLRQEPLEQWINRTMKRGFDFAFSFLVTLFVLSWLVPVIGILIKLSSRGPIFFVQERSGKDNKVFKCYKFRSMVVNNAANLHQATKNDSRITWVGKLLRKTNLDEFPQFFNVLKGEMSIVGPRPHMLKHTFEYSQLIGQYMVRQFVKPGITGWAQVNGFRGETKNVEQMEQRVQHDLWYLENWSLALDFKIVLMTAYNTVKGEKNAY